MYLDIIKYYGLYKPVVNKKIYVNIYRNAASFVKKYVEIKSNLILSCPTIIGRL